MSNQIEITCHTSVHTYHVTEETMEARGGRTGRKSLECGRLVALLFLGGAHAFPYGLQILEQPFLFRLVGPLRRTYRRQVE